ncbi:AfsR/SARP family transcriptional regulator [Nocardia sp. NRRL S-836]|uniref:AfsR/SARP family transcriptional regulator n=1 Tax=Nocardia sp. NRRL S-836 TaxID=1519492 RepID=UPI0018D19A6E|nr:AfsR/SARP family transcriptional regulator [Nocardia sp. NRRL S-836]
MRTLLALLVVGGRRVVGLGEITDALWTERPPDNARAAVQTHVSALRRVLGGAVVHRGGGYLLDVPDDRVDLWEWERLIAEGRRELAGGRFTAAERALGAALELFRGEPLGGAHGWWVEAERARLADACLAAREGLFDALLGAGAAVPLPELAALVERHPLRERLRGQLVVALGRAGRRSDALAAYQEGRRLLVEEMGVEPGPELRAAQQRVLRGEDEGTAAEPEHVPHPVPGQLPPDIADFTGRSAEVAAVVGAAAGAVVAVSGKPGAGKSTLAVHAAHRLRERFPDGVLHVCLHGAGSAPLDPAEVLGRFLRALGVPAAEVPGLVEERTALFRSLVAARRVLVVLDDAADERQVRPLLPGGRDCLCIVTSRARLTVLEGAAHVDLDVLDETGSLALLERIVGAERLAAAPDRAAEVARLCGHLPLALRVAGARLAARPDWPLARLADRLRGQRRLLDELVSGDLEVRGSLALSYAGLTEPQRAALRLLGWLGTPDFTARLVAALLEVDVEEAEDLVDGLVHARLLDPVGLDGTGRSRYRLHDLTRVFAWERAEHEQPRELLLAAARRAGDRWAALVEHASGDTRTRVLRPGPSSTGPDAPPDWLADVRANPVAWFEAEQATMVHAVERLSELELVDVATRLAALLCSSSFAVENRFADWWRTHDAALAAARRADDRAAQGLLLAGLGWLRSEQDRVEEAADYYAQAAQAYAEVGDTAGQAVTGLLLSTAQREHGRLAEALATLDAALPALRAAGEPRALARAAHSRALTLTELGGLDEALTECDRARAAYEALDDEHGVALTLRSRGIIHRAAGRVAEANGTACGRSRRCGRRMTG